MMKPRKLRKGDDGLVIKDWISTLPDAVLADILSFLPTKDVVATSVLSRRWRHVFTWVTRLEFDDSRICHCLHCPHEIGSFPKFKTFVDNVLQACQSENLTTFRLCLGKGDPNSPVQRPICTEGCFPELKSMHFNGWISFPLTRGVRELDIYARVRKPGKLPSALYGCQTLEVLKLDVNLDLGVPSSFCLPNLKELHLTVLFFPLDDSVTRLVSNCPSLEHLALKGVWDAVTPINISSPSLRRLALELSNMFNEQRSKLVLDVRNLKHLMYFDTFALGYSIGDMSALCEAKVQTVYFFMDDDCIKNIVTLVSSLYNVGRLFLMDGCVEALSNCDLNHELPVFRNLKHLQLGCFGYIHWHKVLMELLRCAPSLETLAFPDGITFKACELDGCYKEVAELECQSWSRTQTIPACFDSHLKSIKINRYERTQWELEFLKYFLKNALLLEELVVACETKVPLAERILLESTLQKVPRGSMTCSIKVHCFETDNQAFETLMWFE